MVVHGSGRLVHTRLFGGEKNREGIGEPKGYANNERFRYVLGKDDGPKSGLPHKSPYLMLGIETSCDDTGVAVVSSDGQILSNFVYPQYSMHESFGGIVPGVAMEAHKENIDRAIDDALRGAGLQSLNDIDAVAVTKGPGLEICLRVGLRRAQEIARMYSKPLVTVHHLEAHCLVVRLCGVETMKASKVSLPSARIMPPCASEVYFPFLALIASGGHTSLLICKGVGNYEVLGGTLDDALGEAFDKAARLMGMRTSGNGGAAIEAAAKLGSIRNFNLRVPMRNRKDCNFSYAGLKNQFRVAVEKVRKQYNLTSRTSNAPVESMQMVLKESIVSLPSQVQADLSATFQDVAFSHIEDRVKRAIDYIDESGLNIDTLVVVGGVAANKELRRRLTGIIDSRSKLLKARRANRTKWKVVFPPIHLCTDNGVMAAWAGIEKVNLNITDYIEDQDVISRWPLGNMLDSSKLS